MDNFTSHKKSQSKFSLCINLILFLFLGIILNSTINAQNSDTIDKSENHDTCAWHVGEPAFFHGGKIDDFDDYLRKKINYPLKTLWVRHNRHITIQIVIDKKDQIKSAVLIKDSGIDELDNEIINIVNGSKGWRAPRYDGQPIETLLEFNVKIR